METVAMIVLGVSILGLIFLFCVKNWEEKHARIFWPSARLAADGMALDLKAFLIWAMEECKKLGPTTLRVSRLMLHDLALSLAALSRASERAAHQLADMVSHKHHFERKETKNDFLKQVGEFPIRNLREMPISSEASRDVPSVSHETRRDVQPVPPAAARVLPEVVEEEPALPPPMPVVEEKPVVRTAESVLATPSPVKKGRKGKSGKGKGQSERQA